MRFAGMLLLPIGLILAQALPATAAERVYKVAVDAEFAPFEFTDEAGRVRGIVPDILRAISDATGSRFELVPMSWSEAVDALQSGRIDMLQMIHTEKRAKRYAFSTPFIQMTQALFVRRDSSTRGMDDIAGKRIAIQKHDIADEMLAGRDDFRRAYVDNKHFGMELVQQGEADGFFAAELSGQYLLRAFSWPDVRMAEGGLNPQPLCFTARPDRRALIAMIDQELAKLKASGRLDKIIQCWTQPETDGGTPLWPAALALALLVLALVFAFRMRARGKQG